MRALIVDDEPLARRGLVRLAGKEPDVEIVGQAGNGRAAVEAILSLAPDVVLLDVQMPEMSGLEVVTAVGVEQMPLVVFVTAFDEHAIRAFELAAVDYILKPVDEERFRAAIARVRRTLNGERSAGVETTLRRLVESLEPRQEYEERIVVRGTGGAIRFVRVSEIDLVTSEDNYVRLHTGGGSHLLRETVHSMERRLDPSRFVRVRRSTIVRIDAIREIHPLVNGAYELVLHDGRRVSSSRHYRANLEALIGRG
jgi:two-component system, LytTR family, response regulator